MPALCRLKSELAGVPRCARLHQAGAGPGESKPLVQPRTEASGTALAGGRIHDQQRRVGRWHAPDCALAVNVQKRIVSLRCEIEPLTAGPDDR